MQVLPLGRPGLAQTALVSLLTLAGLALLGLVLAYWTWAWFAPRADRAGEARKFCVRQPCIRRVG
jgi:hypothetical protein